MPEFHSDSLVPPKYGVTSPFAKLTWGAIILVVLGVGALFVTKFDFSRLRGADHFIGKARQAIIAKDWPAAVQAIHHVQGSARERAEFLRVLADFLEATHAEPGLLDTTLNKLGTKGLMLPVDFIWACRLQVAAGKVEAARKALERVPAASRHTAEVMKLNIDLLRQEGRMREAGEAEQRLIESFPDDPEIVLLKAIADLQGPFSELQNAALQRLWNLAKEPNEYGLKAIRVLSQQTSLTLSEATRLLDLADKASAMAPAERLRIVSVIMQLDPARRAGLVKAEIERYRHGGHQALAQLALWLAQEKESDKVLALVLADPGTPRDVVMQSPELFTIVVQGLAGQGRWSELLELIPKSKKLPVANALVATWRALAVSHLRPDDTREPRAHLEEAFREAKLSKDNFVLSLVARMAEERNMPDLAVRVYEVLAGPEYGHELEMLDKCWQMAARMKDSGELLRFAERLVHLRPSNVMLVKRRDYLRLLRGEQIETTLNDLMSSDLEDQQNGFFDLLRALKAYRLQDMGQVAVSLSKIRTLEGLTMGERAVCAGLFAANGNQVRAYPIAEKVRPQVLLEEEELLWEKAF